MNTNKTYGPLLNEKFAELSMPDVHATWSEMSAVLDREMPVEKRRRYFFVWLMSGIVLVSVIAALVCWPKQNATAPEQRDGEQGERAIRVPAKGSGGTASNPDLAFTGKAVNNSNRTNTANLPATVQKAKFTHGNANGNPGAAKSKSGNSIVTSSRPKHNQYADSRSDDSDDLRRSDIKVNAGVPGELLLIHQNPQEEIKTGKNTNYNKAESLQGPAAQPLQPGIQSTEIPGLTIARPRFAPKRFTGKGWVFGLSLNYNRPVSEQEMSTVSINGKQNSLVDFIPSVYAQYHFSKKWYLNGEFQFTSPQYTRSMKLLSTKDGVNATTMLENAVWLNKLYYMNVPVSLHFRPLPHLSVGTGLQYSYLKRGIFMNEDAVWENLSGEWVKTSSVKEVKTKSNNGRGNGNANGNGNGGGNGNGNGGGNGNGNGGSGNSGGGTVTTPVATNVDTAASSLRSSDFRALFDINYSWRRFNGGFRYNIGLNKYINTKTLAGDNFIPVQDRNQAFLIYLRYDLFDLRKKK